MALRSARQAPSALAAACSFLMVFGGMIGSASSADETKIAQPAAGLRSKTKSSTTSAESEPNYVAPTIEYDEIIDPGKKRHMSSLIGAEFALRSERVDRSIQLARRAIQRDPDDMDSHKALAEALDRKLDHQEDKDPKVFAECVKEWLIVMRNGVGMEKGTNFHGIGVDYLFQDDDYYITAKARLKHLTGYAPKLWETNEKYLKRVLQPADTSLRGRILKKNE